MPSNKPKLEKSGINRIIQLLAEALLYGVLLFASAGRLDWWSGWAYMFILLSVFLIELAWIKFVNPNLIIAANVRGKDPENVKDWDNKLVKIFAILWLTTPIIAGLDSGRYGWSQMPIMLQIIAFILLYPAQIILPIWAASENAYHYKKVAITKKQKVCKTGPYKYIRHPTYAGIMTSSILIPILLGSWLALIPGILIIITLFVRTELEDKTLQKELKGYKRYSRKVRYKLVPGVW